MKKSNLNLNIPIDISFQDIIEGLCSLERGEVLDFVIAIDLTQADVGFTEELIQKLVTSVRKDFETPEEFIEFVENLKN
jgi:hypothetical protein